MKELPPSYLNLIKKVFPKKEKPHIKAIYGGGSQRQYFRLENKTKSYVLCYSKKQDELEDHIEISLFFQKNNIPVPEIYEYNREEGLILFEDAGNTSLEAIVLGKRENESKIIELYIKIIDLLIELQKLDPSLCKAICKRDFDRDYYRWETDYFLKSCIEKVFNINLSGKDLLIKEFNNLAEELSEKNRVIVHRDFQSQNIYVLENKYFFIDFQSARTGLCQYDLASLLYDPYVALPEMVRNKLLDHYYEKALEEKIVRENYEEFMNIFYKTSMQRLMQAMGAYGFLGLVKEKKSFLKFLNPGKKLLLNVCTKTEEFPCINRLVKEINSIEE